MENISVCVPTYNNEKTIKEALDSIFMQSYQDYEIVIVDDNSSDKTLDKIREIRDNRIRLYVNPVTLGCGRNLNKCISKASNDIVFFLCGDDVIISKRVFDDYLNTFIEGIPPLGELPALITRNYYWFKDDCKRAIRRRKQYKDDVFNLFKALDQISGIAFRKSYMLNNFANESFIEMASVGYPMYLQYQTAYVSTPVVAVRVHDMDSVSFKKSPIKAWYSLCKNEPRFIDFIARNYIGLVQIKNYGTYKQLLREIRLMIEYRWKNIFNIWFCVCAIGTLAIPKKLLRGLVELYRKVKK